MSDFLVQALKSPNLVDERTVNQIALLLNVEPPTALARATGLLIWKRAWHAQHGEQRGGDRRSAAKKSKPKTFRFCSVAAEKLGLTERAIELDVQMAEALGPALIEQLWPSKIADNGAALRAVSRFDEEHRARLLAAMGKNPDASFSDHLVQIGVLPPRDGDQWVYERLCDLWEKANRREKRSFLASLGIAGDAIEAALAKKGRAA